MSQGPRSTIALRPPLRDIFFFLFFPLFLVSPPRVAGMGRFLLRWFLRPRPWHGRFLLSLSFLSFPFLPFPFPFPPCARKRRGSAHDRRHVGQKSSPNKRPAPFGRRLFGFSGRCFFSFSFLFPPRVSQGASGQHSDVGTLRLIAEDQGRRPPGSTD